MLYRFTAFFASKRGIILAGAVIGLLAPLLQWLGNPPNMGVCVACFERDIAGALGLHSAAVVQYIRPEIIGFVLGSLLAAMAFKEFRARSGSAPIVRFVLGVFAMIGALAFLGCPWRALLRLSAGDLNAVVGIVGLALGIGVGVFFLRNGFNLGRSQRTYTGVGLVFPLLMVGLLVLAIFQPKFSENGPIFASESGPGAMHAPLLISLVVGLVIGALAQRTRFCTMGAVRDIILMRDFHLFWGIAALVAVAFVTNLALGQFQPGYFGQPVAHSDGVWNFLGMTLAGLAFALAGGCPGRQLILAGEGDGDAATFALGMIVGAGFAHNFATAARPDNLATGAVGGLSPVGMGAVVLGLIVCLAIGFTLRERLAIPEIDEETVVPTPA
ncbi:MAG: YedE-related selenium metabolism membrane protein [Caldilineaceae bacterium]|nr:YedE-related selenium metabolism membrane protein [Caldilineaceae bacterium]